MAACEASVSRAKGAEIIAGTRIIGAAPLWRMLSLEIYDARMGEMRWRIYRD